MPVHTPLRTSPSKLTYRRGCRCDECKAANAEDQRRFRASRRKREAEAVAAARNVCWCASCQGYYPHGHPGAVLREPRPGSFADAVEEFAKGLTDGTDPMSAAQNALRGREWDPATWAELERAGLRFIRQARDADLLAEIWPIWAPQQIEGGSPHISTRIWARIYGLYQLYDEHLSQEEVSNVRI